MDVGERERKGGEGLSRERAREGETEVREREKERAEGGAKGGRWRVCPGDARQKRRRGTRYSPGRGLFYMSAPADSSRQEFRSSFCHRAYT